MPLADHHLDDAMLTTLRLEAQMALPQECCGLLFPEQVVPLRNRAIVPNHQFHISAEEFLDVCQLHGGTPWAIYHSHPDRPPVPSVADCCFMDALEDSQWRILCAIIGLRPPEIRVFQKQGNVYQCVQVYKPAEVQ